MQVRMDVGNEVAVAEDVPEGPLVRLFDNVRYTDDERKGISK